jgi:hypothetical protein
LFIKYSTNKVTHFGHISTSPCEEGHAVLKSWLQSVNHDILGLLQHMQPYSDDHIDRYRETLASHKDKALPQYRNVPFCDKLNRVIARKSLNLLHEQRLKARDFLQQQQRNISYQIPVCIGVFKRIHGMPCSHELVEYLRRDDLILKSTDFHAYHCLLDDNSEAAIDVLQQRLLNPLKRRNARQARALATVRYARGTGTQGNRREPTFAERTDPNNT